MRPSNTQAGPEISVASTKAYVTQIAALYLMGLHIAFAEEKHDPALLTGLVQDLLQVPDAVEAVLGDALLVEDLAQQLSDKTTFFYLGRGYDFAVSLEAALKLKEISYLHAEAYAAGEMKHGPLALVEGGVVVVCLATQPALFDKMLSNIKEVSAPRRFGGRCRRGTTNTALTMPPRTFYAFPTFGPNLPHLSPWFRCNCSPISLPAPATAKLTSRATWQNR